MTAPRIIALASPAPGSGKSEVAKHLVENHGFELLKFAGPLKAMTRTLLREIGYDDATIERYVEGDLKESRIPELGVTCRHVMQTLGTEWGRKCIHEDVWAQITLGRAVKASKAGKSVVIDDMRYRNEHDILTIAAGGKALSVERPGVENTHTHSSEGELYRDRGVPMPVIHNSGSINDLRAGLDRLLLP